MEKILQLTQSLNSKTRFNDHKQNRNKPKSGKNQTQNINELMFILILNAMMILKDDSNIIDS